MIAVTCVAGMSQHLFLADPNNLFNLFPLWQEASATIQDLLEQLNTAKKGRKV